MHPAVAVAHAFRQLQAAASSWPNYEEVLAGAYSRFLQAGDVVIDVGAHGGKHTEQFAKIVGGGGLVIAFEPLPYMARALVDKFSGVSNVEVRALALSDHNGITPFVHARGAPEESGLRQRRYNTLTPDLETIQVDVSTLDRQCCMLPKVSFIKIDIEGGEIHCLRGGAETIRQHQPVISVEYGQLSYEAYGHERATLYREAAAMGYLVSDLFGNIIESEADWLRICDSAYWDYFLVPQSRAKWWQRLWVSDAHLPPAPRPAAGKTRNLIELVRVVLRHRWRLTK